MSRFAVYNFSGELADISHLFPSDRLGKIAAILGETGGDVRILDRANFADAAWLGGDFARDLRGLGFYERSPAYDRAVEAEAERLAGESCDVLFVNLWHGQGFKFSVDLAARLKQADPSLRVYGVGQKVDWFKGHLLELAGEQLDGLITGLGYNAVAQIARGRPFREIPNTIFLDDRGPTANPGETIDVDAYPPPIYDGSVYRHVDQKVPVYSISLSNQACPHQCVFCIRPENYGRSVRRRDPAAVLAELERLYAERGVCHFRVEDSTPPRRALTDLAAGIAGSALRGRIALSGFSRVDVNSEEDFPLMKAAGFVSLFFGLESLDDDGLKRLRKGISYEAVRRTLRKAHDAGIRTVACFVFPAPGETRASMENTLRRIGELKPMLDSVLALPALVAPPTAWGRDPGAYGIRLAEDYVRESIIYPLRYEIPIRHWRPLPFTYRMMGKEADEVVFGDIASVHEEFVRRVKEDFDIPRIPDYYFLLAHLLGKEPIAAAGEIVAHTMKADYEGLRNLFAMGAGSAADVQGDWTG